MDNKTDLVIHHDKDTGDIFTSYTEFLPNFVRFTHVMKYSDGTIVSSASERIEGLGHLLHPSPPVVIMLKNKIIEYEETLHK